MFKQWTSHAGVDSSGDPNYINIVTDVMYTVPRAETEHVVQPSSLKKHTLLHWSPQSNSTTMAVSVPTPSDTTGKPEQSKWQHRKNTVVLTLTVKSNIAMEDTSKLQSVLPANDTMQKVLLKMWYPQVLRSILPLLWTWFIIGFIEDHSTNNLHPPSTLYSYGGNLFQHEHIMLRQLDFHDVENVLLTPDTWYSSLNQGTLVMICATLHMFNWDLWRVTLYFDILHSLLIVSPSWRFTNWMLILSKSFTSPLLKLRSVFQRYFNYLGLCHHQTQRPQRHS